MGIGWFGSHIQFLDCCLIYMKVAKVLTGAEWELNSGLENIVLLTQTFREKHFYTFLDTKFVFSRHSSNAMAHELIKYEHNLSTKKLKIPLVTFLGI